MKGKRFLTGVLAVVLGIGMSAGAVLADGSADAAAKARGGYVIRELTSVPSFATIQTDTPAVADYLTGVNSNLSASAVTEGLQKLADDTSLPEPVRNSAKDAADKLKNKEPATNFFDLDRTSEDVRKNADGQYLPRLTVPSLTTSTTGIVALHYSPVRISWEVLDAENEDLANQEFDVAFPDLSPVMILVDAKTANGVTDKTSVASGTAAQSGSTTEVTSSSSTAKSPKTEDTTGRWMGFAAAAVVLAGAAVFVLRRKKA